MRESDLPAEEWARIHRLLHGLYSRLPSSGSWQPYYNATKWSGDGLYRAALEEARESRSRVSALAETQQTRGAWPRGQYRAKFWLRARVETACHRAELLAEGPTGAATRSPALPPTDDHSTIGWLVYARWDRYLVHFWLRDNLEEYAPWDHLEGAPDECFVDYCNWLRRLRSGAYIPEDDA